MVKSAGQGELPVLNDWPEDRPRNWVRHVNQPENQAELDSLRRGVRRGGPFGGYNQGVGPGIHDAAARKAEEGGGQWVKKVA